MEGSGNPAEIGLADADGHGYRVPPHNFEAEMALLGALLTNNRAYDRVSEFLLPEHFADRRHGRIYEAAAKLIDAGQIADPITLKNYFEHDGALDDVGGVEYLARLAASVVTVINAEDYGRTIYDRHLRRELIEIGTEVVNDAYEVALETTAPQQIELAEQKLYDLATQGQADSDFKSFKKALAEAVNSAALAHKREGQLAGVTTGLTDLDKLLGGLHNADLLILAGRPSMGKTALATNIAFNAAKAYRAVQGEDGKLQTVDGAVVAFFSLEMSSDELATRILAEQSQISSHKIRRGDITGDEFNALSRTARDLESIPLFIDDTAGLSVSALRTRARRLKRQHNLGLIIVDYLQLMQAAPNSRPENRVQEISQITRALKGLAKDLDVPVLALSQLSRKAEDRDESKPQLADLRESGSIEQDSDVVMFVYRAEYYLERMKPADGSDKMPEWQSKMDKVHNQAEVIVAKQRHGPIGNVTLYFEPSFTKFSDLVRDDRLPDVRG